MTHPANTSHYSLLAPSLRLSTVFPCNVLSSSLFTATISTNNNRHYI
eukprot:UN13684